MQKSTLKHLIKHLTNANGYAFGQAIKTAKNEDERADLQRLASALAITPTEASKTNATNGDGDDGNG